MNNKPDNIDNGMRFGCGGLFGLLIGCYIGIRFFLFNNNMIAFFTTIVSLICICGFMAMKHGDRFWYSLEKLKNWIWWT